MSRHRFLTSVGAGIAALLLAVLTTAFAQPAGTTLEGWLSVIWGDGKPGTETYITAYVLTLDSGESVYLEINDSVLAAGGGFAALNGQRVQVTTSTADVQASRTATVSAIQLASLPLVLPQGAAQRDVTGSQPWVTILCAFPGTPVGAGTQTLPYFEDMYSPTYPGMDHYWREQSFNQVDLLGSEAYGWFDLPHEQTHYYPDPGQGGDPTPLNALGEDCIAAADATVDFSSFVGINMMFNGDLDCCAWGGGAVLTIDGITKLWRVTFNPPWSWVDITVVSHEIGHGFGLPHANNSDGDNNPYDSPWDVMSDPYQFCALSDDPNYGCLGQHTNAGYKESLGWMTGGKRLVVNPGESTGQINLDQAALQIADDPQVIIIPLNEGGTHYYAVEARMTTNSGYDVKLPGDAVIIWEMNLNRSEWAWQVGAINDATSSSVSDGPDGAWLPGETFSNNGVTIEVISKNAEGFVVSINVDDPPTPTATATEETPEETSTPTQEAPEATPTATETEVAGIELLENTDFEVVDAENKPDLTPWVLKNGAGDKIKCNKENKTFSYTGDCAFRFKGGAGENSKIQQTVDLDGLSFAAGDTIQMSGFINASNATSNIKVKVVVKYDDGSAAGKIKFAQGATSGYTEIGDDYTLVSASVSKIKAVIGNKSPAGKLYIDTLSLSQLVADVLIPMP